MMLFLNIFIHTHSKQSATFRLTHIGKYVDHAPFVLAYKRQTVQAASLLRQN